MVILVHSFAISIFLLSFFNKSGQDFQVEPSTRGEKKGGKPPKPYDCHVAASSSCYEPSQLLVMTQAPCPNLLVWYHSNPSCIYICFCLVEVSLTLLLTQETV